MLGWILYFKEAAIKNKNYIELYIKEGYKLGIEVKLILVEELDFGVSKGELFLSYKGKCTKLPDFAICRAIYPLLSKHLEKIGVRVFNNSDIASICNDKARTYQYLADLGIPMVDSEFCLNSLVEDRINNLRWPLVVKTVEGHGGNQVYLLKDEIDEQGNNDLAMKEAMIKEMLQGIGKSDVVIQPLVGSRYQDLRVYVIGDELIASVLRKAKSGFKSNYSLGGEVCLYELSNMQRDLVKHIISQFNIDFVGIDFIVTDQGDLLFNEIEDVVGSRMLYHCSDINIVELYMRYIKEQV